jgi:hypothetical protein
MPRLRVVIPSLVISVGLASTAAGAARPSVASTPAVAGPGASGTGYLTPLIIASKSGDLTFLNLDVAAHDVVHDVATDGFGGPRKQPWCEGQDDEDKKPRTKKSKKGKKQRSKKGEHDHHHGHGRECPVFWSALAGTGETSDVLGLENLKPGTSYSFLCTKHHNMKGTLIAIE